eukprot:3626094-Pyramimonas_sp.AAC.1
MVTRARRRRRRVVPSLFLCQVRGRGPPRPLFSDWMSALRGRLHAAMAVSYTHLTLPTILLV